MSIRAVCASLLLATVLAGCDEDDPVSPRIEALSLRPVLLRLVEGQSVQLDVDALDGSGEFEPRADVVFGSTEPGVATVDARGLVVGRSPGWARVWAESDGLSDTVIVAVGLRFERLLGPCGAADGRVWCPDPWDYESRVPVEAGHGLDLTHIDFGFDHTCGITTAGRLFCWGENDVLQLGAETDAACEIEASCMVEPLPAHRFRALSVGDDHTCAATTDERLFCWGQDAWGAITAEPDPCGGAFDCPTLPREVGEYSMVAAGASHTCALRPDGIAECWGRNQAGVLGIGYGSDEILPPTAVAGGIVFDTIDAARQVTCGLDQAGTRWCWGRNDGVLAMDELTEQCIYFGQFQPCAPYPHSRAGEPAFVSISIDQGGCALDADGAAWCWGSYRPDTGVPGSGPVDVPARVPLDVPLVAVDARASTCALDENGTILCWGRFEGTTRALPFDPPAGSPGLAPRGDA